MKTTFLVITLISLIVCMSNTCSTNNTNPDQKIMTSQTELTNEKIKDHNFLSCMYSDSYFPTHLVDKCKNILLELCNNIEKEKPSNLDQLYKLSHAATKKINDLGDEFIENESELETGARECLGEDFDFIAKAYGFEADVEELIAPRNW